MADTHPEKKYIYAPNLPFIPFSVDGNSLHELKCVDKNGKEYTIPVTNRTQMRVTFTDGSRKTFYFNTLLLQDSTITGSKTHFFEMHIKPVLNFTKKIVGHIIEDKKGNIWTSSESANSQPWVSSETGNRQAWALTRYDGKSLSNIKPTVTEITNKGMIFGILEDDKGSIWFGAFDGVHRYDGKTITDFKGK